MPSGANYGNKGAILKYYNKAHNSAFYGDIDHNYNNYD